MGKKKYLPPEDADAFQKLLDTGRYHKKHLAKSADMCTSTFDKKLLERKNEASEQKNQQLKDRIEELETQQSSAAYSSNVTDFRSRKKA